MINEKVFEFLKKWAGLSPSGASRRACSAFERGLAALRERDFEAAVQHFFQAVDEDPTPEAFCNLGLALSESGRNDQARAMLNKALELQEQFPQAVVALGALYAREGKLDAR